MKGSVWTFAALPRLIRHFLFVSESRRKREARSELGAKHMPAVLAQKQRIAAAFPYPIMHK